MFCVFLLAESNPINVYNEEIIYVDKIINTPKKQPIIILFFNEIFDFLFDILSFLFFLLKIA